MDYLYDKTHKSKSGAKYQVQLIQEDRYFQGKIMINGFINYFGHKTMAKGNVIRWLNGYIDKLNVTHEISPKIPHVDLDIEAKPLKKVEKAKAKETKATLKAKEKKAVKKVVEIKPVETGLSQVNNDEYLTLLNKSISGLLAKYLGHLPDLDSLPQVEDEPIAFARSVSRVFAQLEKVQTWVSGKDEYLNSLVTQDKKPKEQALWDLPPVPLSLVELSQLLQQVNAPVLGGIGQSYLPSLLIGVANLLGNLLHSAMYLIALHSRATNQTVQAMPTEIEIWQGLQELIMRFNPPLEKALTTGKNEG